VYITLSWTLTCGEDEESGGACGEGGIGAGWVSPVSEELLAARIVACRLRLPGLSRVFPLLWRAFRKLFVYLLPETQLQHPPINALDPHSGAPHPRPALDAVSSGGRHGSISSGALCQAGIQAISGLAYQAVLPRVVHCTPSGPRTRGLQEGCRQWLHPVHQNPEAEIFRFSRRRVEPRAAASPPHPTTVGEVRAFHNPSTLQASTLTILSYRLSTGTAVRLTGSWRPSPNPKAQSHELHVEEVDIIGYSDPVVCMDSTTNTSHETN